MNAGDKIEIIDIEVGDPMPYRDGAYVVNDCLGYTWWLYDGEIHREDGPAFFDTATGEHAWFIHDEQINTFAYFQELTRCSDEDIVAFKLKWGEP